MRLDGSVVGREFVLRWTCMLHQHGGYIVRTQNWHEYLATVRLTLARRKAEQTS